MGLLIPVEHPTRLRSPAEIAALYAALGATPINITGWQTRDHDAIDRLIAATALAPTENSIKFTQGRLGESALAALARLTVAGAGYVDVRTKRANLRVWPMLFWAYALNSRPMDD